MTGPRRYDRFGDPIEDDQADELEPAEQPEHQCDDGWADRDHARPCRTCRPWHYACTSCGTTVRACHERVGPCCPACPHTPPRIGRRHTR